MAPITWDVATPLTLPNLLKSTGHIASVTIRGCRNSPRDTHPAQGQSVGTKKTASESGSSVVEPAQSLSNTKSRQDENVRRLSRGRSSSKSARSRSNAKQTFVERLRTISSSMMVIDLESSSETQCHKQAKRNPNQGQTIYDSLVEIIKQCDSCDPFCNLQPEGAYTVHRKATDAAVISPGDIFMAQELSIAFKQDGTVLFDEVSEISDPVYSDSLDTSLEQDISPAQRNRVVDSIAAKNFQTPSHLPYPNGSKQRSDRRIRC
mmetsp:Transcript_32168/g.49186  ORF Transcript_32168/g.49186 Transcript_32168/m.49186 type:complete len:263 (+) Transcript_32168:185-973(+)